MCFLEESYKKIQTVQILKFFESALYIKSGSMPLILTLHCFSQIQTYMYGVTLSATNFKWAIPAMACTKGLGGTRPPTYYVGHLGEMGHSGEIGRSSGRKNLRDLGCFVQNLPGGGTQMSRGVPGSSKIHIIRVVFRTRHCTCAHHLGVQKHVKLEKRVCFWSHRQILERTWQTN